MKSPYSLLFALALVGCANVDVTPPVPQDYQNSQVYPLPFEEVWLQSVDWFASNNVTIEKIEKPSGLLTAKNVIHDDSQLLDCGEFKVTGVIGKASIDKYGSLNVLVRSLSEDETRVSVNFFGEYKLQAKDIWERRDVTRTGQCLSTGELEQSILRAIGSENVREKNPAHQGSG